MAAILTVLVFLAVFALMYREVAGGQVAVLAGAVAIVLIGSVGGHYSLSMALDSIYFETLALIFGMSAVSALLNRSGIFVHMAAEAAERAQGNGRWVLVMMALVTYAIGLTANSIATMVIVMPVTLNICWRMRINPVPFIVAELFAATLGGASTMIGDFPNMIIASAGNLHFNDFVSGMMVPCLVFLAVTLVYFDSRVGNSRVGETSPRHFSEEELGGAVVDQGKLRAGVVIFVATLLGLIFAGTLNVRPGWIAFVAGLAAVVVGRFRDEDVFTACGGRDILFFVGLFIMVGGLAAAGALDWVTWAIQTLSPRHEAVRAVLLMWVAAGITVFIGGDTAAAVFAPVAASLHLGYQDQASWWALALGVAVGSAAALTGANAGSVVVNHYQAFLLRYPDIAGVIPAGGGLSHPEYVRRALPLTGVFLALSTVYIVAISG
jgi:Na+/H+ antiporter NhaD/arsenite permease-like protein